MNDQAKYREVENVQATTYTGQMASELYWGEPKTELGKEFLARMAQHVHVGHGEEALTERDIHIASAALRTLCGDLFAMRHSDQTGYDTVHGDWLKNLKPGDEITVGAQWWNEPGSIDAGGYTVYFLRYDISDEIIYTVDDKEDLGDPISPCPWNAKTLYEVYGQKYKLFANEPALIK